MPKVELTDRFCRAAAPGERRIDHYDKIVIGLILRIAPGGGKTFYSLYSTPGGNGKERTWMRLGRYPDLSLSNARQIARSVREQVASNRDPAAEKRMQSARVSDLVDNYIKRHGSAKRSGKEIERRLRRDVVPTIGDIRLAELHKRDITRVIDSVMDRGSPAAANRLFDDLRAMLRWAKARGELDQNLVDGMRHPAPKQIRERVLTASEIATLWPALDDADMWASTRRIVRLCLVTGQRVGEVAGITRGELDLPNLTWTIPATRTKNAVQHSVPLSHLARTLLTEQIEANEKLSARKNRPVPDFLFPGAGGRRTIDRRVVTRAVRRQLTPDGLMFGITPFTPHDLRRTCATLMGELGIAPHVIGHCLNHLTVTRASITTQVYARYDYGREKREALDLWSSHLAEIVGGGGGKIVPIGSAN